MRQRTWISLGAGLLVLLVPAAAQAASARVRVLNAGPSGAVTIRVDGVAKASRLGVRKESKRFSVRAGRHTFTAVRGTRTVVRRSIVVGSEERVTVVYVVNRGVPDLRVLREPRAASGTTLLRVANYAAAAGAVDVRVSGLVVARGLRYGATTVAHRVTSAVSPTGLASVSARRTSGAVITAAQPLVLATRSVGLFVLVPRGTGSQLLRLAYDRAPPTPTRQPTMTGTRRFGNAVRCERDTWTPKGVAVKRQLTVDGAAVGNAATLALTTADHAGHSIGCTVSATSGGMTTRVRTTFGLPAVPAPIVAPFVEFPAGTLLPGDITTCNTGTWSVSAATFTIRWIRVAGGQQIGTGPTYTLGLPADNGLAKTLACEVVATSDGGPSAAVRSANTVALGIAPTVAIVSKPLNPTESTDAFFTWTIGGGGADTVECSTDPALVVFVPCIGQFAQTYHLPAPGPAGANHTFAVRVTNPVSTAMDSHAWTIVPPPPTITISTAPDNPTVATDANFAWTIGGGGATSITCELDGGAVACSGLSAALSDLTTSDAGVLHTFVVRAANANPDEATDSYPWVVRHLVTGLEVVPGDQQQSAPFMLTFGLTDPLAAVSCDFQGATVDPCASGQAFGDPGAGTYTIDVTAANGTGMETRSITWEFLP